MKKYLLTIGILIITLTGFSQSGIQNNGAVIKIGQGASVKITGSGAGYTNFEDGVIDSDGKIILEGDWYNDSGGDPVFINLNGKGEVVFNGNTTQYIEGTNFTYFENLTLNNSTGIVLGYNVNIDSILSLSNTVLDLNSYDLQIGSIDNLNGSFNSSNMIVTSNDGYFKFIPKLNTYNMIPVGDNSGTTEYSKIYINPYSATFGSNSYIAVNVTNAKHPNNSSTIDYINRYWKLSSNDITNLNARLYCFYTTADISGAESNMEAGQYIAPFWKKGAYVSTSSNYIRFDNLNELGDFTAGQSDVFDVSISISNETTINESSENGASILVTVSNGSFVSNLNLSNWTVNNLPSGVSAGSVSRISSNTARIYLSGNRTTDYDTDITDIEVVVDNAEINNLNSGSVSANTGVTLTANNDAESFTMADDGNITEGNESGEVITITLSGGTFSEILHTADWEVNNLPAGVSYNIVRISPTVIYFNLTSNTTIDYDTDITNFEVIIPDTDIDDHTGGALGMDSGVTFTAIVETFTISMSMVNAPINEGAENGEIIQINISGDTFVASLTNANWQVNNLPEGVSKGSITRVNDTAVQITLSGNRTVDYDADITNVSVTIDGAEITTYNNTVIVSSGVTLTANNDNEIITLSASTINESSEDGAVVTVNLSGGTFSSTLDKTKWEVSNLPEGVSIGSVNYISATQAKITLSGNRTADYDNDIDFNLVIDKSQLADVNADVSISNQLSLIAFNDAESMTIAGSANEGEEDGTEITVTLTGGTFVSSVVDTQFVVTNLPTGVEVNSVTYQSPTQVKITLIGNASEDYDADITNTTVTVSNLAFNDSDGDISINTGVVFTATDEQAEILLQAETITEENEDENIITVNLSEDTFASSITSSNCIVHNLPQGVSVGNYSRVNNTKLELTLSGNRTVDYDSNIDSIYVEITSSGLQQHNYNIESDSITITANDDPENLSLETKTIEEGNENGQTITVSLDGGTFTNSLTLSNWIITNAPTGVTFGSVSRINADTVIITLSGNATQDYDSDIDLSFTVDAQEFDDYSGSPVSISSGVIFEAVIEPVSMIIANNNGFVITEGSEDGAEILVTIQNDEFISTLDISEWSVSYLPFGVLLDTVSRQSNTEAVIKLKGNSIYDFDSNIDTVKVSINGSQFVNQHVNLSANSGVTITAVNDEEVLTFEVTSITERNENNSEIIVNLSGGTFNSVLNSSDWTISNQPSGVTLGNVIRNTDTQATLVLSGNSDTDFDTDLTSFSVTVNANQVNDHPDIDGTLTASGNVTFVAVIEQVTFDIPGAPLTEDNVSESVINLTLTGDEFVDYSLEVDNFILNNAPQGLTIGSIEYIDSDKAKIILSYDRTDFDVDYDNMSITVKAVEIQSGTDLTTSTFSVKAIVELPYIMLSDNGITEGNEDLGYITVSLYEDEFNSSLNLSNWTITNLPEGISVKELNRIDSATVNIILQGNRSQDYDEDIVNTSVEISANELITGLSDVSASSGVIFIAFNDDESIYFDSKEINEGEENGKVITVNLSGGTFIESVNKANWSTSNMPVGVSLDTVIRIDSVTANIILKGNRTQDFDNDITNFEVSVSSDDINDITSGNVSVNTGIEFKAKIESLISSVSSIDEADLNGQTIILSLINEIFTDNSLDLNNFTIENVNLQGLTIQSVNYINDTAASVIISFDNHDFDNDYVFNIKIKGDELSSSSDLYTENIGIYTNDDEEILTVATDADGIFENEESGEVISVNISGGTFVTQLDTNSWVVSGLPEGVDYSIRYNNLHRVDIVLISNTTSDYDINIDNFSLQVPASDVDDYSGDNFNLIGNVEFFAYDEKLNLSSSQSLSENNLSQTTISLNLTDEKFADADLDVNNFVIHNSPTGLELATVTYVNETKADITFNFDNTDFDNDITDFYVTISADELRGLNDLNSDSLTIAAIVENENITLSDEGLTEDNLNNEQASLTVHFATFADANLDASNFILNNAPVGCSVQSVSYVNDTVANVKFNFNGIDFDNDYYISFTVKAAELSVSSSITSNSVVITAVNDEEIISLSSDSDINEGHEDGNTITVSIEGGNFVQNPDFSNWTFTDLPEGVSTINFNMVNDTAVTFTLSGNRVQDFDADRYVNINIPFADVNDVENNISSSYGFKITALNDPEIIAMTDDGEILESHENGEEIIVTISGGTFASNLKTNGFEITNLPTGINLEVTRNTSTQVTLKLIGNRTSDYDEDIQAVLNINGENVNDYSSDVFVVNSGVTFIAKNELSDRILSVNASGIAEDNLDGFVLLLNISSDKFADAVLTTSSFILHNAPAGVSVNSVSYISETQAEITLAFDNTDFDVDITDFYIEIPANELQSNANLSSNNITIEAIDEKPALTISHPGLNELNLNNAELTLSIEYDAFADENVLLSAITLNNAPMGLTVGSFNYQSATEASITLSFDGTDFDTDILDFSITIDAVELDSNINLTSNTLTIIAADEDAGSLIASVSSSLTEATLDNSTVKLQLSGKTFVDNIIEVSSVKLYNYPQGLSVASVTYVNDGEATLTFNFTGQDFDTDINNLKIQINSNELSGTDSLVSNSLIIYANNDDEKITLSAPVAITEGSEDSKVIDVSLSGGTFNENNFILSYWELVNLPSGVSVDTVEITSYTSAEITLKGNATQDYDENRNVYLQISSNQVDDFSQSVLISDNAVVFTAVDEAPVATITGYLSENNLNGNVINIELEESKFESSNLTAADFSLINQPKGLIISSVEYVSEVTAKLTFDFDYHDFDTDKMLKVEVNNSVLTSDVSAISNELIVYAVDDDEMFTMHDDGEIIEGNENGEIITLTINGGTFVDAINILDFTFNNMPIGVVVNNCVRVADTTLNFILAGNASMDYDTNLTQFEIIIPDSQFDDYSGQPISVKGGVIFIANADDAKLTISADNGLNENNIDGKVVGLKLAGENFANVSKSISGFTLNNAPVGLSVEELNVVSYDSATIKLGYIGDDFDVDYSDFSITIDGSLLTSGDDLTSNILPIYASIEPVVSSISYDGNIEEGNEDGELISVKLSEGIFNTGITSDDINLSFLPAGVSISNINILSDTELTFKLAGNRTQDYDVDEDEISCIINTVGFDSYYGNNIEVATDIVFKAFDEQLAIETTDINQGNLNGHQITMYLLQDYFIDNQISTSSIILHNAPAGTTVSSIEYVNDTAAILILAFNGAVFTSNIPDFAIEIDAVELFSIENLISNSVEIDASSSIYDKLDLINVNIYADKSTVFVEMDNIFEGAEPEISIFDIKGGEVYHSDLLPIEENKIELNVISGNYLVKININGKVFVSKVFILPE